MLSVHVGRTHAMPSVSFSKMVCLQKMSSILFTDCCISAQTSDPPAIQLLRRNNLRRRKLLRMLSVYYSFTQTTHINSNNAVCMFFVFQQAGAQAPKLGHRHCFFLMYTKVSVFSFCLRNRDIYREREREMEIAKNVHSQIS